MAAQVITPRTTLSAAITDPAAVWIAVTSASSFAVGYGVYVDAEFMVVTKISGTNIGVIRGACGTRATKHLNGSYVWVGPQDYFITKPRFAAGTDSDEKNLPKWNIFDGKCYNIIGGKWIAGEVGDLPFQIPNINIGDTALNAIGNATSLANGTTFWASIFLPKNKLITGIGVLNAGTVGTNKLIAALYPGLGGAVLAYSAVAGATTVGANSWQQLALTTPYYAVGPCMYYVAVQGNGATDNIRTIAASLQLGVLTESSTGTFATLEDLVAPTTFTANVGPIAYLY